MKRREFIAGLGAAVLWPMAAQSQQPAMSVIGYLEAGSPGETRREFVGALHRGLSEAGYVEGRNLSVEYRWAEDHPERLSALAAELVRRQVAVIVAQGAASAIAAKAATKTIPIVFLMGADPVEVGLVASLNKPGGNLTGFYNLYAAVAAKRLELLHEAVPGVTLIAYLKNPTDKVITEPETRELEVAARILGARLLILNASDQSEIEAAFATLVNEGADALLVGGGTLFFTHFDQIVALAAHHRVPAMYNSRQATVVGGLMSYGTDLPNAFRQVGIYAGRILKGEKPADLPVQQAVKLQLAINMKAAKALGLAVPASILLRADEVIE
jgi:putative ABC transport system substrate-binding protein